MKKIYFYIAKLLVEHENCFTNATNSKSVRIADFCKRVSTFCLMKFFYVL